MRAMTEREEARREVKRLRAELDRLPRWRPEAAALAAAFRT